MGFNSGFKGLTEPGTWRNTPIVLTRRTSKQFKPLLFNADSRQSSRYSARTMGFTIEGWRIRFQARLKSVILLFLLYSVHNAEYVQPDIAGETKGLFYHIY